ncbi:hypothetical protein LTR53_005529 [Teratosphaeriaceae sp. CCFEE 6253]|nr:hypothetical protein LTR53_005529 [Teratosphaeriaceae sp. CCFEE 6253]
MSNRSPRDRLQKLFGHKQESRDAKREDPVISTPSPPASPSGAAGGRGHVRQSSSHRSLRDIMAHGSNRVSRVDNGRASNVADFAPPATTTVAAQPVVQPAFQPSPQVAATRAMYADQDMRLPDVAHPSRLSTDLQHLTLSDAAGREPHSEDVADRNITTRKPFPNGMAAQRPMFEAVYRNTKPLIPQTNRHSEDVAGWNMVQNERPMTSSSYDHTPPLKVKRKSVRGRAGSIGSPLTPVTSRGLSHKQDNSDLRRTSVEGATRSRSPQIHHHEPRSTEGDRHRIKRSSLEKPLPTRPSDEFAADLENDQIVRRDLGSGSHPGYTTELADKAVDLTGIVDLSKTEDATLHERWAPAVTHETVVQDIHHVREERITREIHTHHYFHRVLPIIDIEVLPARHFAPIEGGYAEISADEVPGRTGANAQWLIAELASKGLPKSTGPIVPERFTARTFAGKQGDYKESVAPEGHPRTETTWVYPPTFYEPGAVASGQTYPFFLGSPDSRDDGLRARLPHGEVLGVSPLLAMQRREQAGAMQGGGYAGGGQAAPAAVPQHKSMGEAPPAVPQHKIFPAELVDRSRAVPGRGGR